MTTESILNPRKVNMFQKLPEEIVLNIFLRLPAKSLVRLKCVGRAFSSLINDPQFLREHASINKCGEGNEYQGLVLSKLAPSGSEFFSVVYKEEDDDAGDGTKLQVKPLRFPGNFNSHTVRISSCCRGLVCIVCTGDFIVIWNPTINEYRKLPPPPSPLHIGDVLAIGYDPMSDDYKIIKFLSAYTSRIYLKNAIVEVFDLKNNLWKTIEVGEFCYSILGEQNLTDGILGYQNRTAITVNGRPHWIAQTTIRGEQEVILYFDATQECFGELSLPLAAKSSNNTFRVTLQQLKGCLCLYLCNFGSYISLWVMKEYGVSKSWTKVLTIPHLIVHNYPESNSFLVPLWSTKNGKSLVRSVLGCKRFVYNPEEDAFKAVIPYDPITPDQEIPYVESLVSPHGGYHCNNRHLQSENYPPAR